MLSGGKSKRSGATSKPFPQSKEGRRQVFAQEWTGCPSHQALIWSKGSENNVRTLRSWNSLKKVLSFDPGCRDQDSRNLPRMNLPISVKACKYEEAWGIVFEQKQMGSPLHLTFIWWKGSEDNIGTLCSWNSSTKFDPLLCEGTKTHATFQARTCKSV